MTRAAVKTSLLAVVLALAACQSSGSLVGDVEKLFGASSPPAKYLAEIGAVHEGNSFNFKPGAESALERTRTAVRGLGGCDYATWLETAYTVKFLGGMADEHPSSLVRAESLETLTRLEKRMFSKVAPPATTTTKSDMVDALLLMVKEAPGKNDSDREMTGRVTEAVNAVAAYPFERLEARPPESADQITFARAYLEQLRTARGALRTLLSPALVGFEADPGVREALDTAYVNVSGAVIHLTVLASALQDPAETTRASAIHGVAALGLPDGVSVLRTVLIDDGVAAVRREAAVALAAYPPETSVPPLIEGLSDEMADVRGAAVRSLENVTGETFGDDRAAWVRWWQTNGAPKAASGASR